MEKAKKEKDKKVTLSKIDNLNIKITSQFNGKTNLSDLLFEIANNRLKEETPSI